MPLIQPLIQSQPQITQSPNANAPQPLPSITSTSQNSSNTSSNTLNQITTTTSSSSSSPLVPQQPSTSAVSSSSSSPISSAQNLSSTTRDWFTYVYKIENIEDLIKNHESQQNFVQSPIFSFTNHIINTANTSSTNSQSGNLFLLLTNLHSQFMG